MATVSLTARARSATLLGSWQAWHATPPTSETADRWLIGLRWIAIVGMLATTLIAKRLAPDLELQPILVVLGAIVGVNLAWRLIVARRIDKRPLVTRQVVVDVVALTVMLWFAGGTSNPFAAFLTFHIVLAGLLCGARVSVAVAALTLAATLVLSF